MLDFTSVATNYVGYSAFPKVVIPHRWFTTDTDWTIAVWASVPASPAGNGRLWSTGYNLGRNADYEFYLDTARRPLFRARCTDGISDEVFGSTICAADTVCCFAITYDYSAREPRIYIDGSESSYYAGQGPTDFTCTGSLVPEAGDYQSRWITNVGMGGFAYSPGFYHQYNFRGNYLIGPAVWHRLLTASELAEVATIPSIPTVGGSAFTGIRGFSSRSLGA